MTDDSSKPKKLSLSGSKLTLSNIDASKLRAGPSVGGARKRFKLKSGANALRLRRNAVEQQRPNQW